VEESGALEQEAGVRSEAVLGRERVEHPQAERGDVPRETRLPAPSRTRSFSRSITSSCPAAESSTTTAWNELLPRSIAASFFRPPPDRRARAMTSV
jgi:hypothetical protein